MDSVRWAMIAVAVDLLACGTAAAQQRSPAERTATVQQAPTAPQSAPASGAVVTHAAGPSADPIIVTGRPLPPKEAIKSLSRAITPYVSDGPLPRFNVSVCFGTAGLPRRTLEHIGYRLALDAELAGLKLAGDRCTPNVYVLFVDGVGDQVAALVRRKWWVFGDRSPSEIREIVREPGPVRAWSNSEVRGADGQPIGPDGILRIPIATRIAPSIRRDTLAAIVLIERAAVVGKAPSQIGDYVAMRALGGVHPPRAGSPETILSLFDAGSGPAPVEMTAFDRGYLRGLYAQRDTEFAGITQGRITRSIVKAKSEEQAQVSRQAP
ncbi:hypothetical protein [uncultured Sphingomonas sp.]|uniref:hypothetical protein n=1 Tax=uncultured Sphingomonas sp. TaxID=158754 RepID=UPI0025EEF57F|nr:hypothetical protein [uncultured Sphingomonas sp.]